MSTLAHLYAVKAREWVMDWGDSDSDIAHETDHAREVFRCAVGWTDEDWKLVVGERQARLDALLLLAQEANHPTDAG